MMDTVILLMICVTGFFPGEGELCTTYTLRPQWEMTQEIIDRKIELVCDNARRSAIKYGGHVTKCEIVDDTPDQETA